MKAQRLRQVGYCGVERRSTAIRTTKPIIDPKTMIASSDFRFWSTAQVSRLLKGFIPCSVYFVHRSRLLTKSTKLRPPKYWCCGKVIHRLFASIGAGPSMKVAQLIAESKQK